MSKSKQLAALVCVSKCRWTPQMLLEEAAKLGLGKGAAQQAMADCDDIVAYPLNRKRGTRIQWYERKIPPPPKVPPTPFVRAVAWSIAAFTVVMLAGKELSDIIQSWFY